MSTEPTHPPALPSGRDVDVLVVGGGPAGLSAALMLGRSRRSVLVVDAGVPRNAPAAGVHGFLTRDGTPPGDLLAIGRAEVEAYGVTVVDDRVDAATRIGDRLRAELAGGGVVHARRLVVTSGLVDILPDVPGVAERWGRDVLHCPYCHGWEVRDQVVGILASGPAALHQARLFRQLTDRVVVLRHTTDDLAPDEVSDLRRWGVAFVDGKVACLEADLDRLTGARLVDGRRVALEALVVAPAFTVDSPLLRSLGVGLTDHPSGLGRHVQTDAAGRTAVPGVWAAGNVTDPMAQVVAAAAQGNRVGAALNADLVAEDLTRIRRSA